MSETVLGNWGIRVEGVRADEGVSCQICVGIIYCAVFSELR